LIESKYYISYLKRTSDGEILVIAIILWNFGAHFKLRRVIKYNQLGWNRVS